ncbi:hypothetical protein KQX54_010502 [Cotesia glomerata]|uniref:EF-hand domain-containing protein n=1 Tax=Cotesia glomerata TaxID=32391 RepID=A0AAV7HX74_COTGL|nr:hypothetical protein KQX54_010502 [Cotesia glomerata]
MKRTKEEALKKVNSDLEQRDSKYDGKFEEMERRFTRLEAKLATDNVPSYSSALQTTSPPTDKPEEEFKQYMDKISGKLEGMDKQLRHSIPTDTGFITLPTTPFVKTRWSEEKKNAYKHAMLLSQKLEINFDFEDIETLSLNITAAITKAATSTGMTSSNTARPKATKRKPWFDDDCLATKKQLSAALRRARQNSFDPQSLSQYLRAKKEYKDTLNTKLKDFRLSMINKFAEVKNSTEFWRTFNSFRRKHCYITPLPLDTWVSFYSNIYPQRIIDNTTFFGILDPITDGSITFEEIRSSVKAIKKCEPSWDAWQM